MTDERVDQHGRLVEPFRVPAIVRVACIYCNGKASRLIVGEDEIFGVRERCIPCNGNGYHLEER